MWEFPKYAVYFFAGLYSIHFISEGACMGEGMSLWATVCEGSWEPLFNLRGGGGGGALGIPYRSRTAPWALRKEEPLARRRVECDLSMGCQGPLAAPGPAPACSPRLTTRSSVYSQSARSTCPPYQFAVPSCPLPLCPPQHLFRDIAMGWGWMSGGTSVAHL